MLSFVAVQSFSAFFASAYEPHGNAEAEAETYGTTRKGNTQIKASFVFGGERLKQIISQVQDF